MRDVREGPLLVYNIPRGELAGKKAKYIVLYLKILFYLSLEVKKYFYGEWKEDLVSPLTSRFPRRHCRVILYVASSTDFQDRLSNVVVNPTLCHPLPHLAS